MGAAPVTLLFTDLVNSTELLQRTGDEGAQRIFEAHHKVLKDAVAASGGHEVRWMGDGLMVAFPSTADAVRCAMAMQQAARRPIAGQRLGIRVGLNVGEVLHEGTDYFGLPVVIARRLCDHARSGQILCTRVVAGLLEGRQAFRFADCGALGLKGIAAPVAACEVLYEPEDPAAILSHPPFVGRTVQLATLGRALDELRSGHGGLVMLVGEPGIGKTRTLEEVVETARTQGAEVLWGRCYEGEASRPYGAFAEALAEYARRTPVNTLRADLGLWAAPLMRVAPGLREQLPDIAEPVALQPDEERVRLLDAVVQWLLAVAGRAPTVLVLDDLHWADQGTVALLRHTARFAPRVRLLLLGAFRDVDVERTHPLNDALGVLPRETSYVQIALGGLEEAAVRELLETLADHDVPPALVTALTAETSGNPFFIREVLLHLVEQGRLVRAGTRWTATLSIAELGLPDSVRQVIGRRVARLSQSANRLLTVGSACSGAFRLQVVARVAGVDEAQALDALDDALAAQLLRPATTPDSYEFTHALIRHTLYGELNRSRQVRLHREIAEAMVSVYGERASEHAAELTEQFYRSRTLPGAERGVAFALEAADRTATASAHGKVVSLLRQALDLLAPNDSRRPLLLAPLARALTRERALDEALDVAQEAGELIAAAQGGDAAADQLAETMTEMSRVGFRRGVRVLAAQGLRCISKERRDLTWLRLSVHDIVRQEAENPDNPGMPLDTPERRAVDEVARTLTLPVGERAVLWVLSFDAPRSRSEALERSTDDSIVLRLVTGDCSRGLQEWERRATQPERDGVLAEAGMYWSHLARCHNLLGAFAAARAAHERAVAIDMKFRPHSTSTLATLSTIYEMCIAQDEGWEELLLPTGAPRTGDLENYSASAFLWAGVARVMARLGRSEAALQPLERVLPALERAPGWAFGYPLVACDVATTLWLLNTNRYAAVVERSLHEKVLGPDFRWPMQDARLCAAYLCALNGRYQEARDWFAKARVVLDEEGARPLRATVDYDEALMYVRRRAPGDAARARALLDMAIAQFREIGMAGWIKRAEALRAEEGSGGGDHVSGVRQDNLQPDTQTRQPAVENLTPDPRHLAPAFVFRQEGEFWTIAYGAKTFRLKDVRGLAYIAHLLRHPGREFHAMELAQVAGTADDAGPRPKPGAADHEARSRGDAGEFLDARAVADYKQRLVDLGEELEEAQENNDAGRIERLQSEKEFITRELARALGLHGEPRPHTPAELARVNVRRGVKVALDKIAAHNKALVQHLTRSIKTGAFCTYDPDPGSRVDWQL